MKTAFFTFILSTIITISAYAQITYSTVSLSDLIDQVNLNKAVSGVSPSIQGSPYLINDFVLGEVFFDGKYKIEKVPLRLNLYNGELEFKDKNVVMAMAQPQRIDKVVMGDYTLIFVKEDKKQKLGGFVRMWNPELPSIITQMSIDFLKKEPAKPYVEPKPDRFERSVDRNYIMISKDEIYKITSVKKLIEALGNHQDELSEFAKKEKISSGNVEELVSLVEYYHTLK